MAGGPRNEAKPQPDWDGEGDLGKWPVVSTGVGHPWHCREQPEEGGNQKAWPQPAHGHQRLWTTTGQAVPAGAWAVPSALLLSPRLLAALQDILLFCWAYEQEERPTFTKLMEMLEKLPKRNRRLSHPGHFWKSAE